MTAAHHAGPLLQITGLKTHFFTQDGVVKAVDDVTFEIGHGQTLGVVGESGCGKSVTAMSAMRLIERPGRIVAGEVLLNGENLLAKSDQDMRDVRGDQMSMIFQEPMTSLNPVFTCGDQIAEAVQQHTAVSRREAWDRAVEMLRIVGIPDAKRRAGEYPHQLSGGMRQRVMIAMALSTDPDLLIADEPTTALDVTIQAQILEVMRDLRQRNRMAIMLITHDLGVVAEMADEVVVMYAGKVVERGDVRTIYGSPHHPYTSPLNLPTGCLFKRRCPYRMDVCDTSPPYQEIGRDHYSRCWLTPAGEAPDVGADAEGDEAVAAAEQLTVEAR
jgi:ABC-type dipeptide/oligopeptide/nickel transport system ATPase component